MVQTSPPNAKTPIDILLGRIADHMDSLASTLAIVETATSKHLGSSLTQDLEAFKQVQKLDYLRQSMTDTAALLTSLSHGHRAQHALLDNLKLEITRGLVSGSTGECEPTPSSIQLF